MITQNQQPLKETETQPEDEAEVTTTVRSIAIFVWDLVKIFFTAFVLVWLIIRPFIAEPFVVSGSSMVPNFHNREYLIVEKLTYRFSDPERGDVVVFKYPIDPDQYFIKRIIGLPGEQVFVSQGRVVVKNEDHPQGFVLDEQYLPNQNVTLGRSEEVMLGTNQYYVLGDNRLQSSDSRVWGPLPKANIVGKVWLRVLPLRLFGFISHHTYSE
ncbi:MAG: signal peptidase I [Candidatus Doudnabacteria bacterium]|nr:signal peptidase I [Candidatus Doudnabacteria bacterium]